MANPFLVRELRQLERRPRGVQSSLLCCLGAMALALTIWLLAVSHDPFPRLHGTGRETAGTVQWFMLLCHMALCGIAAGYGGYRLFAVEHYRSTFDSLQLLPISPSRWLALKLSFPFACLLIAWLAGLPIYILAAVANLVTPDQLPYLLHKPLILGVGALFNALLATPDFIDRQKRAMAAQTSGLKRADNGFWLWNTLIMGATYAMVMSLLFGTGLTSEERFVFRVPTTEGTLWLVNALVVVPAAWLTSCAAIVRSERIEKNAHRLRVLALLVLYLTMIGLMWSQFTVWLRALALLAIPLVWFFSRDKETNRKENVNHTKYVNWVMSRWDNPLLIHDLRVYGRNLSVQAYFLRTLASVVAVPAVIYLGLTYAGRGNTLGAIYMISFQICLQIFPMTWASIQMFWLKEWTGQTLPQLLITPLTEREIILGRMLAVPAFHWVGTSPIWLLAGIAIFFALLNGIWIVAPAALAISPLALSMGAWLSGRASNQKALSIQAIIGDLKTILLRVLQLLVIIGCFSVFIFGNGYSGGYQPISPILGWGMCLGLFVCNAVLCRAWINLRVEQLRRFRTGDIEVPDSTFLKQPARKRSVFGRRARVVEAEG